MKRIKKSVIFACVVASVVVFGLNASINAADAPFSKLRQIASESSHVNSDQQRDFEEHLAKKRAEFQRNMDRVKAENDEMRRQFDAL